MSCSTLSVSSEWESTDSVEGATGKRGKEIDQQDIAKYLASMSGEVECTERKVGKKKERAVKKAEKKAKKKEQKEAKKEREAVKRGEKAKLKALKKAVIKAEKAKKKEVKEMKKKTKRRWRRTSKVTPMVIVDEATLL